MITFWGILIGTGIIWLLKIISAGLAGAIFGTREREVAGEAEEKKVEKVVPTGPFILVDTLVCGLAGFLMGRLLGWFFIGISWKKEHVPGMAAFIGLSILGSVLHG